MRKKGGYMKIERLKEGRIGTSSEKQGSNTEGRVDGREEEEGREIIREGRIRKKGD